MALEAPNFFDPADFARMRTPSQPYDPNTDYGRVTAQLKESLNEHSYLGISPQNLTEPAELLPVIVIPYYDKPVRVYVAPRIEQWSGGRFQIEGCANIRLVRNDKKATPGVKVFRPTSLVLSHMVEGQRITTTYHDKHPEDNLNPCPTGIVCHEIAHTNGKLLADFARRSMEDQRKRFTQEVTLFAGLERELQMAFDLSSPKVLVREGDKYVLRLMSEFKEALPEVSPDTLFVDYLFARLSDLYQTFVPREGEFLPIEASQSLRDLYEAR